MDRALATNTGRPPPLNWWPMIFSVFIVFYPLELLRRGEDSWVEWALAAFAVVSFVTLIAIAVAFWQRRRPFVWAPIMLGVIGFYLAGHNYTAELFFVFAAAIFPWAVQGHVQRSVIITLLLVYTEMFEALLLHRVPGQKAMWLVDVPIFTIGNAACAVWIVGMTLSVRRLAQVAEQERITRDLHDVLGDVLSRISQRSKWAGQLLMEHADAERARQQIAAVETISRGALADVRQAIRRYRTEPPDTVPQRRGHQRAGRDARVPPVRSGAPSPVSWWPMVFTIYIVLLPVGFYRAGGGSAFEWLLVALGVVVFLALAAIAIVSRQRRRPFLRMVFLLALLGIAFAHRTPSAIVFMTFAAAVVPWAVRGNVSRTAALIALLIVTEFLIGAWNALLQPDLAAGLRQVWWITAPILTAVSAAGYLWAVRMSLRHLGLAKRAECERIARDLHDVLGHTLSLITLKSELAGRLLAEQRNAERARAEIADVTSISRQAPRKLRLQRDQ